MFTTVFSIFLSAALTVMAWSVVAILRRHKSKMPYAKRIGCLMALVGFFTGCFLIAAIIEAVCYRDFHYTTADEMKDAFLPKTARDITHRPTELTDCYRFKVSENELRHWFGELKSKYRERRAFHEWVCDETDALKLRFHHTGWPMPSDLKTVGHITIAENGAGFGLLYSPGEGTAYCFRSSR